MIKIPRWFEWGEAPAEFATSLKDEHHWIYFELLGLKQLAFVVNLIRMAFKSLVMFSSFFLRHVGDHRSIKS